MAAYQYLRRLQWNSPVWIHSGRLILIFRNGNWFFQAQTLRVEAFLCQFFFSLSFSCVFLLTRLTQGGDGKKWWIRGQFQTRFSWGIKKQASSASQVFNRDLAAYFVVVVILSLMLLLLLLLLFWSWPQPAFPVWKVANLQNGAYGNSFSLLDLCKLSLKCF